MTRLVRLLVFAMVCTRAPLHAETTPGTPDKSTAVESARLQDVLRLFDIDESVLRFFADGQVLSHDELEPVYRLMYVLPRLDAVQRDRWRVVPTEWVSLVTEPTAFRAEMFELLGQIKSITRHELPLEAARRFDYDHFDIVEIESTIDGRTLVVCTPQVPAKWTRDPVGEAVSCDAIFLKVGSGAAGKEPLVFVTDRIAWHPHQPNVAAGISPGAALLGQSGMDISLFDHVEHQRPLGAVDRDCFYELLWAVRRIDPSAVTAAVSDVSLPVVRVLQQPENEVGRVYRLRGTARRALRIRVDEPDIQERFGIDHYYEIELFTPLDQSLQLIDPADGETRGYQNYPVTVCVAELPPGMPQGDEIRQDIIVEGFFMKLWSYRSRFATGAGNSPRTASRRQISPLIIARSIRLDTPPSSTNNWPAWFLAAMVTGGIVLALSVRWWFARGDRPLEQWRAARRTERTLPPNGTPPSDSIR